MAIVQFSPDREPPPLDQKLEELGAAALASSKALKIRVQPDLYNYENGSYQAWNGLVWMIEVADVEEGRKLREALTLFFRAFGNDSETLLQALAGVS